MSGTGVGVHVFLPGTPKAPALMSAPSDVLDLFRRFDQPLNYGGGPLSSAIPFAGVLQFAVRGIDKVLTGKQLLVELERMGYEACLHISHASSHVVTGAWWPQPPNWPTWEWSTERVAGWVADATNNARPASGGEGSPVTER